LDFFDSKSGSTAVFLPVLNACNLDAFVAPLLRGATSQDDRSIKASSAWHNVVPHFCWGCNRAIALQETLISYQIEKRE
jgi:hypothetical protein